MEENRKWLAKQPGAVSKDAVTVAVLVNGGSFQYGLHIPLYSWCMANSEFVAESFLRR